MKLECCTWHRMHSQGNRFIIALTTESTWNTMQVLEGFRRLQAVYPADQWILLYTVPNKSSWAIKFWNADESVALACGNGTRCAAHLLYRLGLAEDSVVFQGPVSELHAEVQCDTQDHAQVTVFQGVEKLCVLEEIQQTFPEHAWHFLHHHSAHMQAVNVGNLHLIVCGLDSPTHIIDTYHARFGQKFLREPSTTRTFSGNISYVCADLARQEGEIATWEYGVGPTGACGSAACAALATFKHVYGCQALALRFPGGVIRTHYDQGCWHCADSYYLQ